MAAQAKTTPAHTRARTDPGTILDIVIGLLDEFGYDGWQLSDVARKARASLTTIYKNFPSRDDLIVAALERWMADHAYRPIQAPRDEASPFAVLRAMLHVIFEPWEENPGMLRVFVRATTSTAGAVRLTEQGTAATKPLVDLHLAGFSPTFVQDLDLILTNVVQGALTRYLNGQIAVNDILPIFDRTLHRLEQASTVEPRAVAAEPEAGGRRSGRTTAQRRTPRAKGPRSGS